MSTRRLPTPLTQLIAIARACFDAQELPPDVDAVWWPRFKMMAPNLIEWELNHRHDTRRRIAEADATPTEVGQTGVTLGGRADRIDIKPEGLGRHSRLQDRLQPVKDAGAPADRAAAVARRRAAGAWRVQGHRRAAAGGSRLCQAEADRRGRSRNRSSNSIACPSLATELAEEAWRRLERLLDHYENPATGYRSRALPFREGDTDGDYDHLARVLEWSAGGDSGEAGDGGEGGE